MLYDFGAAPNLPQAKPSWTKRILAIVAIVVLAVAVAALNGCATVTKTSSTDKNGVTTTKEETRYSVLPQPTLISPPVPSVAYVATPVAPPVVYNQAPVYVSPPPTYYYGSPCPGARSCYDYPAPVYVPTPVYTPPLVINIGKPKWGFLHRNHHKR